MNCEHVQAQLALFVYCDTSTPDAEAIRDHLASCSHCRQEHAAIERVRGLLDRIPSASTPALFLPRLYERLAKRTERKVRRWRWAALLALATGAALAALALLPRLELRVDREQLTLRWGREPTPAEEQVPMLPDTLLAAAPTPILRQSSTELEEQLSVLRQIVREIVRTPAREGGKREEVPRASLMLLEARLAELERRFELRLRDIERDFRTLYRVQFASRDQAERGGKP